MSQQNVSPSESQIVVTQPELSQKSASDPPVVQGLCEHEPIPGPSHALLQVPPWHVCPPVQTFPHVPQFELSVCVLAHEPEQHDPFDEVQSVLQLPQCWSVVFGS